MEFQIDSILKDTPSYIFAFLLWLLIKHELSLLRKEIADLRKEFTHLTKTLLDALLEERKEEKKKEK
jgi:hypothetical protein